MEVSFLMQRKLFSFPRRFVSFLLLFCIFCGLFSLSSVRERHPLRTQVEETERVTCVVLDAGHGGEDGGAVSADGAVEKDLNLQISFLIKEMLETNGIKVVMTRETDTLLYDKNADYQGRKKVLDLAARKKIAEETVNSVFVSIHMNTYPLKSCRGLQVWYSPNHPRSKELAKNIQKSARELVQPENQRTVKPATSGIYLLHKLHTPAVLVECGFLSSPEEARLLTDSEYQKQLAFSIFSAIINTDFSA